MARLYTDENFSPGIAARLRPAHDVLTCQQAGQSGRGVSDEQVLAFAHALGRAILTHNRKHFRHLHEAGREHSGIIICTADPDASALSDRIDTAIAAEGKLAGKLIRVVRPLA